VNSSNGSDGFFFVQVSDLQFGMWDPGVATYRETPLVEMAVARINALSPAFVLCTGDLVDLPGNEAQLAEAQRLLAGLDRRIPLRIVPGNHDIGDTPTAAHLAWYRRHFGPDRYSFDHGGWHVVGVNSCLLADHHRVAAEAKDQWVWLEQDLAGLDARGGRGFVFLHHPLFLEAAEEEDGYFNLPRRARFRILELLRAHGIDTVFAGHLHCENVATDAGVTIVTNGPVGMPLRDGESGFRIVKAGLAGLEHRYFALEDVAAQQAFVGKS
jgi:3',5'-cyclic AMP phosphodiesterase CpdA